MLDNQDKHCLKAVEKDLFFMQVKKKVKLVLIIVSAIAFCYFPIPYLLFHQVDIDAIYKCAVPENEIKGPELKVDSGNTKLELELNKRHAEWIDNESAEISEKEKLAVINKWNTELYPLFNVFMLSTLMDSMNYTYYRDIVSGATNTDQKAELITTWTHDNLLHTQHIRQFFDQPGKEPWGSLYAIKPVYKKVLPSEMVAKSLYTGKITGKCCSLAAFITDLFALNGASLDNILVLRMDGHNIGLVKYNNKIYLCNNQNVSLVGEKEKSYLKSRKFLRFFTYSVSVKKTFSLDEKFFKSKETLLKTILKHTNTNHLLPTDHSGFLHVPDSREELFARVFSGSNTNNNSRIYSLARYSYQSLHVRNPELYLKASVRAPVTKEISKKVKSKESIFQWIASNIKYSPIFYDYENRIMLADQVIIFRKGTKKDQAVLAYSLLKLNGYDPTIRITRNSAYIEVDNEIYGSKEWKKVAHIVEPIEISIRIDS